MMHQPACSTSASTLKALHLALAATALAAISLFAYAGDSHKKCDAPTQACLDKMAAKLQAKAWLGIETTKLESGWYQVSNVIEGSPAAASGLQAGDILVTLNGVKIHAENKPALVKAKKSLAPGVTANYVVKRDGSKQQVAVTLTQLPAERIAQYLGQHLLDHHATERVASIH